MYRTLLLALLCTCAIATAPAAYADNVTAVFNKDEIAIIRDYYLMQGWTAAQTGGKQKGLPPGIAKNLARGKPLPPGIAKRYLPNDLIKALPPVHPGYERVIIDGRVLLVEIATQIVRDVLYDVVTD